jgi:heme-degrading monooxygenase HmoA
VPQSRPRGAGAIATRRPVAYCAASSLAERRPRDPNAARGSPKGARMIVVTNRIPVADAHKIDFEDRFKRRAHLVDRAPGFIRNEVHRPRPMKFSHETGTFVDDPEKEGFYEVKTWWRSMEDFVAWTKSPAFAEAHADRAPKEMFRGPSELLVHEVFLSTDLGDGVSS